MLNGILSTLAQLKEAAPRGDPCRLVGDVRSVVSRRQMGSEQAKIDCVFQALATLCRATPRNGATERARGEHLGRPSAECTYSS